MVVIARPARIIGVQSEPLAVSLTAEVGGSPAVSCGETERGWRCRVEGSEAGPAVLYSIDVDDWGCWDAGPTEPAARGLAESACIWLPDYFN